MNQFVAVDVIEFLTAEITKTKLQINSQSIMTLK